jgi:hypothetical protein
MTRIREGVDVAKKKSKTSTERTPSENPVSKDVQLRQDVYKFRKLEVAETLGKIFLIGLFIVLAVYVGIYLPIKASSGRTTSIDYFINFVTDIKAHIWLSWAATAGATGWALNERKKRLKEREEKDKQIIELQKQIDPHRTSSDLTPAGVEIPKKEKKHE